MKSRIGYRLLITLWLLTFTVAAQAQRERKKKEAEPNSPEVLLQAETFFTEGEKYFILEDYAKALYYFQKSLELNPRNATVHYKMAEILSKSEKAEDRLRAAISADRAIELDKTNKYFYLLSSSLYGSLGQFGKAAEQINELLENVPDQEEYLYQLAAIQVMDKKTEQAIASYNKAEQLFGVNETSSIQKQQLYYESGKMAEAIAEGEKLIKAFPDEERYVVGFAEFLSQNKQGQRGIEILKQFIADHPDSGASQVLLAGLYQEMGAETEARQQVEVIIGNPAVALTSKLLILGSYQQAAITQPQDVSKRAFAADMAARLQQLYPAEPDVHLLSGDLLMANGDRTNARIAYRKAIGLGASNFEAWQNLCALEMELNMMDSLTQHSEQALEFFPNQASFYYFSGFAQWRLRQFKGAAGALEEGKRLAISQVGLLTDINLILGETYHNLRDYPRSDKAFEDALTLAPNHEFVLNNYSYYLALRKENLEKAERMASQLIKDHPQNANYWDTYAWVLFMRDKFRDARKAIEKCVQTGPANATHFEHYGDILYKLGDEEGALEQWKKAKSIGPASELIDKKIANRKLN